MSLTDKLRELADASCDAAGFAVLAAEAERLEAENHRLRDRLHQQTIATQESSQRCHDDVLKVIQRHLPEGVSPQGHPIEQLVGTVIHSMEAKQERLRELVREAYNEGYIEGDVGDWTDAWEQSEAKAELDEMGKEGTDEA